MSVKHYLTDPQLAERWSMIVVFLKSDEREAMSDPFYGYQPSVGLYNLKDVWCQKAQLGVQSQALAEHGHLLESITATMEATPVRRKGFRLDRQEAEVIHESEQKR